LRNTLWVPLLAGFGGDLLAGDPARWHPVAGFGRAALAAERTVYAPSRARGALFAGALVGGAALAAELLARRVPRGVALAACSWAALGGRSLRREAVGVADRVLAGDLDGARAGLPALCGRDAQSLDAAGISRATVESVAENTSDGVVAPLLWGAVAGPAGVVAYRAANTLDAMVGHHGERYEQFGWASARLDDALNWPAARAGAALTCLCAPLVGGSARESLVVTRRDGRAHPSPNAGMMEAAFAGALGLRLGGPLSYEGRVQERPSLGAGRVAQASDVARATRLSLAVGLGAAAGAAALRTAIGGLR
jgi:adenosylcobinamide-phosphate synthase